MKGPVVASCGKPLVHTRPPRDTRVYHGLVLDKILDIHKTLNKTQARTQCSTWETQICKLLKCMTKKVEMIGKLHVCKFLS